MSKSKTTKPVTDEEEVEKPEQETTPDDDSTAEDAASKKQVKLKGVVKKRSTAEDAASFEQTVADIKEVLANQPKVRIFVPLEPGEPKGTLYPVEINGYKVKLPKNVYVEVPQSIADIVMQSLNVYEEASAGLVSKENGSPMRLDLKTGEAKSALNS